MRRAHGWQNGPTDQEQGERVKLRADLSRKNKKADDANKRGGKLKLAKRIRGQRNGAKDVFHRGVLLLFECRGLLQRRPECPLGCRGSHRR
jgi:hypothetical protein